MIKTFEQFNELDPYGEDDWEDKEQDSGDIYFTRDILNQMTLHLKDKHLQDDNVIAEEVYDYIKNYFLDFEEKRFEEITNECPIHFIIHLEGHPVDPETNIRGDDPEGFIAAKNGKLEVIQWD